jgi:hypothetical protein
VLLAGGGVRGGRAHGAMDRIGARVTADAVTPADLAATILDSLGVDSRLEYGDEFQRCGGSCARALPCAG